VERTWADKDNGENMIENLKKASINKREKEKTHPAQMGSMWKDSDPLSPPETYHKQKVQK